MSVSGWCWSQVRREVRRSVGASNTTMPLVDSLSPALSPLVPRRERERAASTMVVLSRCARDQFRTKKTHKKTIDSAKVFMPK